MYTLSDIKYWKGLESTKWYLNMLNKMVSLTDNLDQNKALKIVSTCHL